jgi:Dolichyl-phosphate-mannose-protein mannosyltransferase
VEIIDENQKARMNFQQHGIYADLKQRLRELAEDRLAWLILAISLTLRYSYWWIIASHSPLETLLTVPPDSLLYTQLAQDFYHLTITSESNLYMAGFGYSSFLGALLALSGKSYFLPLFCQIALSGLTSVLLYTIGVSLTGKKVLGLIAALIHALSITAIVLSVSFLSETLFFFLLCLIVILFIRIVRNPGGLDFLALGLLLAYAVFTRSVAQFLPPVFLILGYLVTRSLPARQKVNALKRIAASVAISLILIATWGLRNYAVHDTFVIAGTGAGAAATYLAPRVEAEKSDSLSIFYYRSKFARELRETNNSNLTYREINDLYTAKFMELLRRDPLSFIKTYLGIVKENVLAVDQIAQLRMPGYESEIVRIVETPSEYGFNIAMIALAALGLVILFSKRMMLSALMLSALYLYFAGLSGFTFWQGSRILFPGMLSMALLVAAGLYYPTEWLKNRGKDPNCPTFIRKFSGIVQSAQPMLVSAFHFPNRLFSISEKLYRRILLTLALSLAALAGASLIVTILQLPIYRAVELKSKHRFLNSAILREIQLEEKDGVTQALVFRFYLNSEITDDYSLFLHLYPVTAERQEMINRDFVPGVATTLWPVGVTVSERVLLDLTPGEYSAALGFITSTGHYIDSVSFNISVR